MKKQNIIIFDGECLFCNKSINFIIKRDKKEKFIFTTFQSEYADVLFQKYKIFNKTPDTVIVIKNDICYIKSDAVFEILKELSFSWSLCRIFKILPKKARDYIYDKISQNRYRFYGKKDICMTPTTQLRKRFYE